MAHVAVIGGGLMGMSLAYFLAEYGQQVTVLEQGSAPGGLHDVVQLETKITLARYQHHISLNDRETLDLIQRLNLQHEVYSLPANSGFVHNGDIYPMRTLGDFFTFGPLRMRDRLRLGQTIVQARLTSDWQALDRVSVKEWLIRVGGKANFERIWAPLLEAKFDYDYENVPATFIWSWLNRAAGLRGGPQLRASISYLRYGPAMLVQAMADALKAKGAEIRTQTRVREIEIFDQQLGRVRTHTGIVEFDAVIAAIPTPEFGRLILNADEIYLKSLSEARYLGLVCPALIIKGSLSDYWTLNLTDPSSPFSSIVEMPCPDDPQRHIVYLPKYTAPENDWMGVSDEVIQDAWLMRLRQIFPSLKTEAIEHIVISRSRYVDPVYSTYAAERLPAVNTPVQGLYIANSSQVYPELPTTEAVIAHARRVAQMIVKQGVRRLVEPTAA